jgi:hypothetical protein
MYEALALELEQNHKEVLLLALATETETVDLKEEPEPTAILPAPGGAANGLIATSLSTYDAAPSAADFRRHGAARGAAKGGGAGGRQLVARGRGDQHRQGGKLVG